MNNTILTTLLFALLSLSCAKASDSGISHNTKYTTTKSSIIDSQNPPKNNQSEGYSKAYERCISDHKQGFNLAVDCTQKELEDINNKINKINKILDIKKPHIIKKSIQSKYENYERMMCNDLMNTSKLTKSSSITRSQCKLSLRQNYLDNLQNILSPQRLE
jgi:hypothetical protein